MLEKIETAERSRGAIPVAQPAAPRAAAASPAQPENQEDEALITPTKIKSWATSLVAHALLLLVFALWVFTPPRHEAKSFDTTLGGDAGSSGSGGDDTGSLKSLGLQEAELTLNPSTTPPAPTSLAELDPGSVVLDPTAQRKAAVSKNAQPGGVNLPNPGAGGSGEGFGLARFGTGTETIGGVGVKVGDPQFTLIWDTQADIDLHVIEPGGSEIYWEQPHGNKGGELDVDDIDGFGPENVYWVQGDGPPGEYKWFVHYYGGLAGMSVPTHWKVRVKHAGKVTVFQGKLPVIGARSKMHSLTIDRTPGDGGSEAEGARTSPR